MTLLRDFDPCFDTTEEISDNDDNIYDQIDEKESSNIKNKTPPTAKPRTKFPSQERSPKKINFGPPKPPRSFSPAYEQQSREVSPRQASPQDAGVSSKKGSPQQVSPRRPSRTSPTLQGLKTMLSESNMLKKTVKPVTLNNVDADHDHDLRPVTSDENMYVQVPVLNSCDAVYSSQGRKYNSFQVFLSKTHKKIFRIITSTSITSSSTAQVSASILQERQGDHV